MKVRTKVIEFEVDFTPSQISMFANGKSEISSEEIAVNNDEDYILTLLTVVNAYRGRRGYQIQVDSGFVEKDGYRIPRFILKKGGKR